MVIHPELYQDARSAKHKNKKSYFQIHVFHCNIIILFRLFLLLLTSMTQKVCNIFYIVYWNLAILFSVYQGIKYENVITFKTYMTATSAVSRLCHCRQFHSCSYVQEISYYRKLGTKCVKYQNDIFMCQRLTSNVLQTPP